MSTTISETMTGHASAGMQDRKPAPETGWTDGTRPYTKEDVQRLQGTVKIEYTLARLGAVRLRQLLQEEEFVAALGALTGNQAVQQVKAGLKAIYLSGWQVAADANLAGQMCHDGTRHLVLASTRSSVHRRPTSASPRTPGCKLPRRSRPREMVQFTTRRTRVCAALELR